MSCVRSCPVDCFYEDARMLYISPTTCINCRACLYECPVNAIYPQEDLPPALQPWIGVNAEAVRSGRATLVTVAMALERAPLPTAESRKRALGF